MTRRRTKSTKAASQPTTEEALATEATKLSSLEQKLVTDCACYVLWISESKSANVKGHYFNELFRAYDELKASPVLNIQGLLAIPEIKNNLRVNKSLPHPSCETQVHFLYLFVHLSKAKTYIRIPVGMYFGKEKVEIDKLHTVNIFPTNHSLFAQAVNAHNPEAYSEIALREEYSDREDSISPKFTHAYQLGAEAISEMYFEYLCELKDINGWEGEVPELQTHHTDLYRIYMRMEDHYLLGALRYALQQENEVDIQYVNLLCDVIAAIAYLGETDMNVIARYLKRSYKLSTLQFIGLAQLAEKLLPAVRHIDADPESVNGLIKLLNQALIACHWQERAQKKDTPPPVYKSINNPRDRFIGFCEHILGKSTRTAPTHQTTYQTNPEVQEGFSEMLESHESEQYYTDQVATRKRYSNNYQDEDENDQVE